jgi:hypothetical protein
MNEVASNCPELGGDALARTSRALASRRPPDDIDLGEALAAFAQLLAQAGSVTG